MMKYIIFALLLTSCSAVKKTESSATAVKKEASKEFSRGELILATDLLTKIFDEEMAPLACVPNMDEASLLLRTIRPRMELVQDDIEASLDSPEEVNNLIKGCRESCICHYIDELFREHEVTLTNNQKKMMNERKSTKETSRCLSYVLETFCESDLYKTLNQEKVDFSFEE